jgi:hypothetical protein
MIANDEPRVEPTTPTATVPVTLATFIQACQEWQRRPLEEHARRLLGVSPAEIYAGRRADA